MTMVTWCDSIIDLEVGCLCYCNLIGGALDLFMTHFGEDRRGSEGNTAVGKGTSQHVC